MLEGWEKHYQMYSIGLAGSQLKTLQHVEDAAVQLVRLTMTKYGDAQRTRKCWRPLCSAEGMRSRD